MQEVLEGYKSLSNEEKKLFLEKVTEVEDKIQATFNDLPNELLSEISWNITDEVEDAFKISKGDYLCRSFNLDEILILGYGDISIGYPVDRYHELPLKIVTYKDCLDLTIRDILQMIKDFYTMPLSNADIEELISIDDDYTRLNEINSPIIADAIADMYFFEGLQLDQTFEDFDDKYFILKLGS